MKVITLTSIIFLFVFLQTTNLLKIKREKSFRLQRKQLSQENSGTFLELGRKKIKNPEHIRKFNEALKQTMEHHGITLQDNALGSGSFGQVFSSVNVPGIVVKGAYLNETATNELWLRSELAVFKITDSLTFSTKLCGFINLKDRGFALVMIKAKNDLLREAQSNYDENRNQMSNEEHVKELKKEKKSKLAPILNFFSKATKIDDKYKYQFQPKFEQVVQMAFGLREFHSTSPKLIHADIKPANYLVMENNSVVLADFGLTIANINTDMGGRIGTVGFIPYDTVEQNENGEIRNNIFLSQKLDTYALGITILNLIVPQFFQCFNGTDCPFPDFRAKIKAYNESVIPNLKTFKDYLNKNVERKISSRQQKVEQLVFDHLLVERKKRFTSSEFFAALEKAFTKENVDKIIGHYTEKQVKCPDLSSHNLESIVPDEFHVKFSNML